MPRHVPGTSPWADMVYVPLYDQTWSGDLFMPRYGPVVQGYIYAKTWSWDHFKVRHGPGTYLCPDMVLGPLYAQTWS